MSMPRLSIAPIQQDPAPSICRWTTDEMGLPRGVGLKLCKFAHACRTTWPRGSRRLNLCGLLTFTPGPLVRLEDVDPDLTRNVSHPTLPNAMTRPAGREAEARQTSNRLSSPQERKRLRPLRAQVHLDGDCGVPLRTILSAEPGQAAREALRQAGIPRILEAVRGWLLEGHTGSTRGSQDGSRDSPGSSDCCCSLDWLWMGQSTAQTALPRPLSEAEGGREDPRDSCSHWQAAASGSHTTLTFEPFWKERGGLQDPQDSCSPWHAQPPTSGWYRRSSHL